jgi:16S rRNA (adenine1518-N6/adenine1519-N6)-dimethyltransferase
MMRMSGKRPAKKSLGQNFLVSAGIAERIVTAILADPPLPVVEIGPGKGALTLPLARSGAQIAAFEIDSDLASSLGGTLAGYDGISVVNADIRNVDIDAEAEARGWREYALAGNIPYLLTSTILLGIPGLRRCRRAVIMVQKEVGERILASPGERKCGILTVFLKAYLDITRLMTVRASSFRPRPKVDSVVLLFEPVSRAGAPADRGAFLSLLKRGFSQRRKKLGKVLGAKQGWPAGVDEGLRPEQLSLEDWFAVHSAMKDREIL